MADVGLLALAKEYANKLFSNLRTYVTGTDYINAPQGGTGFNNSNVASGTWSLDGWDATYWSDGTLELRTRVKCIFSKESLYAWGSTYQSPSFGPVQLPVTFSVVPFVQHNISYTKSVAFSMISRGTEDGLSRQQLNPWFFYRPTTIGYDAEVWVDVYVRGKL